MANENKDLIRPHKTNAEIIAGGIIAGQWAFETDTNKLVTKKLSDSSLRYHSDDSKQVLLAGTQTITGAKTFSSLITADGGVLINGSGSEDKVGFNNGTETADIYIKDPGEGPQALAFDSSAEIELNPTGKFSVNLTDNISAAFRIYEGSSPYLQFNTVDGSEALLFGSGLVDQDFTFQGSGDFTIENLTEGQVVFPGSGGVLSGDADLFWNNSTKRLSVGAGSSPVRMVHIESATAGIMRIKNTGNATSIIELDGNPSATGGQTAIIKGMWNGNEVARIFARAGDDAVNKDEADWVWRLASGGVISDRFVLHQEGHAEFTGNVGIGTASPSHKLQVEVPEFSDGFMAIHQLGAGQSFWSFGIKGADNNFYFRSGDPASETDHAYFTDTGVLYLDGLTATRLLATDGTQHTTSVADLTTWIAGTTNQITVADDGDGTATLSLPQNIHTGANPTFTSLTLSGLTEGQVVFPGSGGVLSGSANLFWDGSQLGIGTASPGAKLDVEGATDAAMLIKNTGSSNVTLDLDSNRTTAGDFVGQLDGYWDGTRIGSISFIAGDDTSNKDEGDILFRTANGGVIAGRLILHQEGHAEFTGDILAGADFIFDGSGVIRSNTSDGSDDSEILIAAGAVGIVGRGAFINLYGNEHANTGNLELHAGNVGDILIKANGSGKTLSLVASDGVLVGESGIATIKSGSTQANAGAANRELWKTSGHASLPDNVVMIGV